MYLEQTEKIKENFRMSYANDYKQMYVSKKINHKHKNIHKYKHRYKHAIYFQLHIQTTYRQFLRTPSIEESQVVLVMSLKSHTHVTYRLFQSSVKSLVKKPPSC